MKKNRTIRAALMMSATAVLATPAIAQEATPVVQVAPPAITQTLPPAAAPAGESATPVNPEAAAAAEAEAAELAAERQETRRAAPTRRAIAATAARAVAPARVAEPVAQPAVAPAPASAASAPKPVVAETAAPAATPAQAEPVAVAQKSTTTTEESGAPLWPIALIAALIVAAGAFFVLRGRRAQRDDGVWAEPEPVHEQPAHVEPAPLAAASVAAAPVAVAAVARGHDDVAVTPVAAEEASIERADAEDVAALTAGTVAGDRPWLEFAMRPVRAGTNVDEALVEIELTVGNAGSVAAEDVRITTFMLAAGDDAEMDRLLIEPRADGEGEHMTIAAGEGARVNATLVINRAGLGDGQFRPVIVADARYRLPDGSEGRTSASFLVGGVTEAGEPAPIDLARNLMRDDVEAALYRQPERV